MKLYQEPVSDKHPLTLLMSRSRKEVIMLTTVLDDWAREKWDTNLRAHFIELILKVSKKEKKPCIGEGSQGIDIKFTKLSS